MIRFRYRGVMRSSEGQTFTVDWGWANEGAKALTAPSPFMSSRFDDYPIDEGGLGEIPNRTPPRSRLVMPPGLPGDHHCGDDSLWLNGWPVGTPGLDIGPDGWPVCCEAGVLSFASCSCSAAAGSATFDDGTIAVSCSGCVRMSKLYKVTVHATFTNNVCSDCADLNGSSWVLEHIPSGTFIPGLGVFSNGCYWISPYALAPCSNLGLPAVGFVMRLLFGFWNLILIFDGNYAPIASSSSPIPAGGFSCLGSNDFSSLVPGSSLACHMDSVHFVVTPTV